MYIPKVLGKPQSQTPHYGVYTVPMPQFSKCAMCPVFSAAIYRLFLLPVGTANVERSFSTMNRILSSERCRLVPGHTCQLMQLAVEGPHVSDVCDAEVEELA